MAKAPAAASLLKAAPAASSVAKLAMPASLLNPMTMVSRVAPAASAVAKLPTDFIGKAADEMSMKTLNSMKPSWLDRNREAIRNAGLGLMQMGLQQQQQASPMQLAAFQPGGGGGGSSGAATPQLVALAQQLGLNKVL